MTPNIDGVNEGRLTLNMFSSNKPLSAVVPCVEESMLHCQHFTGRIGEYTLICGHFNKTVSMENVLQTLVKPGTVSLNKSNVDDTRVNNNRHSFIIGKDKDYSSVKMDCTMKS